MNESLIKGIGNFVKEKLAQNNWSDTECVRRLQAAGCPLAKSTLACSYVPGLRLGSALAFFQKQLAGARTPVQLHTLAALLACFDVSPDDTLVLEISTLFPGFVYPPTETMLRQRNTTESSTTYKLFSFDKKIKLLRPEHRSVLEGLANTYLARYAEEERADYQGSD